MLCDTAIPSLGTYLRQTGEGAKRRHAQDEHNTFTKAQPGNTPLAHQNNMNDSYQ